MCVPTFDVITYCCVLSSVHVLRKCSFQCVCSNDWSEGRCCIPCTAVVAAVMRTNLPGS